MVPIVGRWKEHFKGLLNPIETPSGDETEPDDSWGASPISLAKVTETKNLDIVQLLQCYSSTVPVDWQMQVPMVF